MGGPILRVQLVQINLELDISTVISFSVTQNKTKVSDKQLIKQVFHIDRNMNDNETVD